MFPKRRAHDSCNDIRRFFATINTCRSIQIFKRKHFVCTFYNQLSRQIQVTVIYCHIVIRKYISITWMSLVNLIKNQLQLNSVICICYSFVNGNDGRFGQ